MPITNSISAQNLSVTNSLIMSAQILQRRHWSFSAAQLINNKLSGAKKKNQILFYNIFYFSENSQVLQMSEPNSNQLEVFWGRQAVVVRAP